MAPVFFIRDLKQTLVLSPTPDQLPYKDRSDDGRGKRQPRLKGCFLKIVPYPTLFGSLHEPLIKEPLKAAPIKAARRVTNRSCASSLMPLLLLSKNHQPARYYLYP